MDELDEFESEVEGLDFLAGVNHVIEKHKADPKPGKYNIAPDHPDMVKHDGEPGYWNPSVPPEERVKLIEEMKKINVHFKQHKDAPVADCHWCKPENQIPTVPLLPP